MLEEQAAPAAEQPLVSVIIATRDRPQLLRRAVAAVRDQTYPGPIECVLVFDQSEPDEELAVEDPKRSVLVLRNSHTPGLPGSRNSGVEASSGQFVAFCDDDDVFLPTKVERQVAELCAAPETDVVATGIVISIEGRTVERVPERDRITFEDLLRTRVMEAHPSTVMVRRDAIAKIGPVDEEIPGGYAEDYEWMLRATQHCTVAVIPEALVKVYWGGSYWSGRWQVIDDACGYLLDRYPQFASVPKGLARIEGQRAFARAAAGRRKEALASIRSTLRHNWREPRAWIALPVALRLVSPQRIVRMLNRRGRGI